MEAEELKPEAVICPHCQHVLGGAVAYCPFCGERQPVFASPPKNADTPEIARPSKETERTTPEDVAAPPKEYGEVKTSTPGESGGGAAQQTTEKREEPPASPQNAPVHAPSDETGGGENPGKNAGHGESTTIHVERTDHAHTGGGAPRETSGPVSAPSTRQTEQDAEKGPRPSKLPRLILIGLVCLLAVWGIAKVRQTIHDSTEQRYTLAVRAYQGKRLTEAKTMLEDLLHDNPDDTRARDLNDQITATRQRHEDMYKRAMRELKSGRKNQARKLLLTIVREDSDNTKARDVLDKYWAKREESGSMQPDSNRPAEPTPVPTPEPAPTPTSEQPPTQAPEPAPAPTPQPAPAASTKRKQAKTVDCQALGQKVQEAIKGFYIQEAGNLASQAVKGQCPQADSLRRKVEDAKSNIPNWQWK